MGGQLPTVNSHAASLLVALVAGLGLLALAYAVIRSAALTLFMFLVVWIATAALRDSVDLSATLGGIPECQRSMSSRH